MDRDELVQRVFSHAMGLAGAMVQGSDAIEELVILAERDTSILEAAKKRTEEEIEAAQTRASTGVGDEGPPEAPALFASRLLAEAIEATGKAPTR